MNRVPPLIAMALTRPFGWAHGRVAVWSTAATAADAPMATKAVVQSAASGSRVRIVSPIETVVGDDRERVRSTAPRSQQTNRLAYRMFPYRKSAIVRRSILGQECRAKSA
ncbi:hypothetical protein GCM10009740_06670 [Terrabacter terrae]|uniref:Secreted protein n=1 Tax=Terrabacter terrae TaxID=318434 RepID=A0ABP5FC53_9MICO